MTNYNAEAVSRFKYLADLGSHNFETRNDIERKPNDSCTAANGVFGEASHGVMDSIYSSPKSSRRSE